MPEVTVVGVPAADYPFEPPAQPVQPVQPVRGAPSCAGPDAANPPERPAALGAAPGPRRACGVRWLVGAMVAVCISGLVLVVAAGLVGRTGRFDATVRGTTRPAGQVVAESGAAPAWAAALDGWMIAVAWDEGLCGSGIEIAVDRDGTYHTVVRGEASPRWCDTEREGLLAGSLTAGLDALGPAPADEAVPCATGEDRFDVFVTDTRTGATWTGCGSGPSLLDADARDRVQSVIWAVSGAGEL